MLYIRQSLGNLLTAYSILYRWIYFVNSKYKNCYLNPRIDKETCFSVLASLYQKKKKKFLELFEEDFSRQVFATYETVMIKYIFEISLPAIICRVNVFCLCALLFSMYFF